MQLSEHLKLGQSVPHRRLGGGLYKISSHLKMRTNSGSQEKGCVLYQYNGSSATPYITWYPQQKNYGVIVPQRDPWCWPCALPCMVFLDLHPFVCRPHLPFSSPACPKLTMTAHPLWQGREEGHCCLSTLISMSGSPLPQLEQSCNLCGAGGSHRWHKAIECHDGSLP